MRPSSVIPKLLFQIVTNMKNKSKLIDWGMVFIFILWLASTEFHEMTDLSWVAGGLVISYLVFYAVRRINNR